LPALPASQKKRRTTLKDSSLKKSGLGTPLSLLKRYMPLIYKTKTVKVKKQEAL
jgi:hypothetical protein